jgi:hypothetical protein
MSYVGVWAPAAEARNAESRRTASERNVFKVYLLFDQPVEPASESRATRPTAGLPALKAMVPLDRKGEP